MSSYTLTNVRQVLQVKPEELSNTDFVKEEVLPDEEDRRVRMTNLHKALTLAKAIGAHTRITFETNAGPRGVEAAVIYYDVQVVWLKGNYKLPITCIRSIDFV